MKRFLMLVGVAVVAAAMYVAAGSASQQSKGVSPKQFKALQKQVATLGKELKTVKTEATAAAGFISNCLASSNSGVLPINEFGDPAEPSAISTSTERTTSTRPLLTSTARRRSRGSISRGSTRPVSRLPRGTAWRARRPVTSAPRCAQSALTEAGYGRAVVTAALPALPQAASSAMCRR